MNLYLDIKQKFFTVGKGSFDPYYSDEFPLTFYQNDKIPINLWLMQRSGSGDVQIPYTLLSGSQFTTMSIGLGIPNAKTPTIIDIETMGWNNNNNSYTCSINISGSTLNTLLFAESKSYLEIQGISPNTITTFIQMPVNIEIDLLKN